MSRNRKWTVILIATAVVGLLAVTTYLWTGRSKPKILVVLPTADNPFWIDMKLGVERGAASVGGGFDVVIRTGPEDANAKAQIDILRDFRRTETIGALLLGPASSSEVVPEVAEYSRLGIPVVIVDSKLDPVAVKQHGAKVDAFLGSNNEQGGEIAAKAIVARFGNREISVLLIEGSAGHETAIARSAGFQKAAPKEWKITRMDGNWDRARAREVTEAALAVGIPNAIFASSDEMAMGVITALDRASIPPATLPVLIGFDATADGLEAVSRGKMAATVKQRPLQIGEQALKIAAALARGEPGQASHQLLEVELVSGNNP